MIKVLAFALLWCAAAFAAGALAVQFPQVGGGEVIGAALFYFLGRSRAEFGRMHDDLRRDWHRRNDYRP